MFLLFYFLLLTLKCQPVEEEEEEEEEGKYTVLDIIQHSISNSVVLMIHLIFFSLFNLRTNNRRRRRGVTTPKSHSQCIAFCQMYLSSSFKT